MSSQEATENDNLQLKIIKLLKYSSAAYDDILERYKLKNFKFKNEIS